MTIQDTCLHHKHTREREQLGPNNKSAVTPSEPVEPRTEQDLPGPNTKLNVEEILTDLEHYHPRRKGWTWRNVPASARARRALTCAAATGPACGF